MTKDQTDYLENWLFRANEDLAVIDNLFKTDPLYMQVQFVFMLNKQLKNSLKLF